MTEKIFVIGAGGHAKVVIATLLAGGNGLLGILDDDPGKWGTELLGIAVAGPVSDFTDNPSTRAIVAVGDNRSRANLVAGLNLTWTSAIHPSAIVHPSVAIGPGTLICAGVVVQPGTRLGSHVIVNTSASVDHDCELADFTHVAPGVHLAGEVQLGAGTMIGVGSSVAPRVQIGDWAMVGAGAAVIGDLAAESTAVGVPARVLGAPT